MSIREETTQQSSVTDKNFSLQLFINRDELVKLFLEYLNDEYPRQKILFLYGDGGNGKSLLLKLLHQKCCQRFPDQIWRNLKINESETIDYLEKNSSSTDTTFFPAILHDFDQKPIEDDRPQDRFYGLLMLRRNLANAAKVGHYRLRFPLFDFACIWYLHQKSKLTKEKIQNIFPSEELELIKELIAVVKEIPGIGLAQAVLGMLNRRFGEEFTLLKMKLLLDEDRVKRIQKMDPDSELIDELPHLLAVDLNVAISQPKGPSRIILFFDTHDAFWGDRVNCSPTLFFERDEWLRCLLANLELSAGIVVVMAGRQIPRWSEATLWQIPQKYLDVQLVSPLKTVDANLYLRRVGIEKLNLYNSLITYASVETEQVHPLFLALCADVILAIQEGGDILEAEDLKKIPQVAYKSQVLIGQLLKYVNEEVRDAVFALSACRAFNRNIYMMLGREIGFNATNASFRILTRFSFVWHTENRGQEWYRIHPLVRRLNFHDMAEITRLSHMFLDQYYQINGDVIESIYHNICYQWDQGVRRWLNVFNSAKEKRDFEKCRDLLAIRKEIIFYSVKSHNL